MTQAYPLTDAIRPVADYFKTLPPERIRQSCGGYSADSPCCVGSHLCAVFSVASGGFLDGVKAWELRMGANRAQTILMLRRAGAGTNPFGTEDWPNPPSEVFAKLMEVEELPDLRRADLTGADLTGADLTGADLTGAYLRRADLTGAYLRRADLTGADLTGAYLTGADLTGAYLRRADLTGADLTGADLTGAKNADKAIGLERS